MWWDKYNHKITNIVNSAVKLTKQWLLWAGFFNESLKKTHESWVFIFNQFVETFTESVKPGSLSEQ